MVCNQMAKRITIMIDDDLDKKLRQLQAKLIQETSSSISFSQVINETIRKSIKK
jgi:predicted transcriptional regulator